MKSSQSRRDTTKTSPQLGKLSRFFLDFLRKPRGDEWVGQLFPFIRWRLMDVLWCPEWWVMPRNVLDNIEHITPSLSQCVSCWPLLSFHYSSWFHPTNVRCRTLHARRGITGRNCDGGRGMGINQLLSNYTDWRKYWKCCWKCKYHVRISGLVSTVLFTKYTLRG